jgi:transcriptional regulator with XRE-family HTH domain
MSIEDSETFGTAVRRLRNAQGLSLRQLNAVSRVDFGHLSKIENGLRPSTEVIALAIDNALHAGGELIAIGERERSSRGRRDVASDDMLRRTLMTAAMATAVAGLRGIDHRGVRVGAADVERLQSDVERLYSLDYQHGGESIWQAALTLAADATRMLEHGTFGPATEHALMQVTGRLQMCAGWLAFDAGRHDIARTCYTEALTFATQAGDTEVATHALANLAFAANLTGSPRDGRRLGEAAATIAATGSAVARLSIIPQLRLAMAHAIGGDAAASRAAIGLARTRFDRDADKPTVGWCSFISPAELDGIDGTCAVNLGDYHRATDLLEQSVAGYSDRYARNRALYRVRLAQARVGAGEIEGAAEAASSALDDLAGSLVSWRVSHELTSVARTLQPHVRIPAVAAFTARHHAAA